MKLWKHPNMRDIAFEIIKSYYIAEKDMYSVKLTYWLRYPETNDYEPMNITERLKLPHTKVREWVLV